MGEDQLIERLKQGDRAAFEYVYFTYKTDALRTICRIVPVIEDAEELVQDVFVKVYKKIHQFNGSSKLSTWIYSIARNTSLNFLESTKRHREVMLELELLNDEVAEREIESQIDVPSPEELAIQKEGRNILLSAFTKLSPDQNMACTLVYLEGMSQIEIAETMDTSLEAVESLVHRGKTKLKSIINSLQLNISL